MASPLDKFFKNVAGSSDRVVDFIPVISSKGDFTRVEGLAAILASWNNILLTPIRSYSHDTQYGSELYKYAFEPADDDTIEQIIDEIKYRLTIYDDRALLTGIDIEYFKDGHGFIVNIDLEYNGTESGLSLSIDGNNYLNFL